MSEDCYSFCTDVSLYCTLDGTWLPAPLSDGGTTININKLKEIAKRDPATRPEQNQPWIIGRGRNYVVDQKLADTLTASGFGKALRKYDPPPTHRQKTTNVPSPAATQADVEALKRDFFDKVAEFENRIADLEDAAKRRKAKVTA